jgi:tetratricopeptide (TPR) repeat protein
MFRGSRSGRVSRGCALAASLAALTLGGEATAQSEMPAAERNELARSHFRAGMREFERGRFVEAAAEFERVFELSGQAALLYNAARAWEDAGRAREAVAAYRRFLEANAPGVDRAVVQASIDRLATAAAEQERTEREGRCPQAPSQAPGPPGSSPATGSIVSMGSRPRARSPEGALGPIGREGRALLELRTRVTYEHRSLDAIAPWVLVGIAGVTGALASWQAVASITDAGRVRGATTWSPELTSAYFASRDEGNTAIAFGSVAGAAALGAVGWFIARGAGERREELLRPVASVRPSREGVTLVIGGTL